MKEKLLVGWNEFQQIVDFAVQNGTQPSQNIDIQTSDGIIAIAVYLRPLHLRPLTEFVFADALLFDEFG